MCGICGKFAAGPVGQDEIRQMTRLLAHRGPDEEGLYVRGSVGLGHRRLSIIDLDTGQQPMCNEDESVWIVFNGEIYNYRQLRSRLIRRGHRFKTTSDTETIIHLYEEYGADCVQYLRGVFAFAIWDQGKQRLFVARDRMGQKPLFYVQMGQQLMFASEIKVLVGLEPSLRRLDLAALDEYLTLRLIGPPRSMFQQVRKLPPAHFLTFDRENGLRTERYWDLSYEPKFADSDEDLIEELESRLVDCIRTHLVCDVPPVGAFLSGGLDSTLIVALLMKHGLAEDLLTFSVGLPYGEFDEAPTARLVAQRYGTRHHEEQIKPSLLATLPRLVWHLDEPSDPLCVCVYMIAEIARRQVKVVLDGTGGDELFGGYDRYYGNRYADYYALIPYPLRRFLMQPALQLIPDGDWYKSPGHQLKWLHHLALCNGSERYVRGLSYFNLHPIDKERFYGPVMRKAQPDFDPGASIRQAYERADAEDPIDRMLYADSMVRLPDNPVMIADRMTMAYGLEARSPFMDHELAEFAARLPMRMKVRGRSPRYIQVQLAKRLLPPEVLRRKKQGFASALPYLLKAELDLLYRAFLNGAHLAHDGILVQQPIDQMLREHQTGEADHGARLWSLFNSEVWYRMYIQGQSDQQIAARIEEVSAAA